LAHIECDDLRDPFPQQSCDAAVTAAHVEEDFVPAKHVLELLDATEPIAELAGGRRVRR
jgi:hypothetical protein